MPPELFSILTGALPELGSIGVAATLLVVFRREMKAATGDLREQMTADRTYFSEERAKIRAEAAEDVERTRSSAERQRQDLLEQLREARAELREADREKDQLLARLYPQDPATTVLPHPSRHRAAGGS